MRITKVHIDEYKIFKNFDIDFTHEGKSQNLIVLAGINGTGKTTLLDYLTSLLNDEFDFANGDVTNIIIDDFEMRGLNTGNIVVKQGSRLPSAFSGNVIKQSAGVPNVTKLKKSIVSYIDELIYEELVNPFDAYKRLQDFIATVLFDFNLKFEFSRLTATKTPIFKNDFNVEVLVQELSSGERQVVSNIFRLFLDQVEDAVILIDEPEFSLHPSWQNLVAKVYQRYADIYNCQIILATHSPQIIGSVKPEQVRILKNDNGIIGVSTPDYSYGLPVDKVLMEVMGINHLRTPDVDAEFEALAEMISNEQYDTPEFIARTKKLEDTLGYTDTSLVLMRFEIAKRRKQKQ